MRNRRLLPPLLYLRGDTENNNINVERQAKRRRSGERRSHKFLAVKGSSGAAKKERKEKKRKERGG